MMQLNLCCDRRIVMDITWLILLTIFSTQYEQGTGQKQQGRHFDVYLTAAQMESTNPKYIGPGAYMQVSRNSRDAPPVMNAFFPFLRDLPPDLNSSWICYERSDNKWKPSLIRGSIAFCDLLETKVTAYRILYNYSNFPPSCPVKKGNYSVTDFKFDTDQLPPVVWGNEWRVRNWLTTGDETVLIFIMELKIDFTKEIRARTKKQQHQ